MRTTLTMALVALSVPALSLTAAPASAAVGIDQGAVTATLLHADGATDARWNHGRRGRHRGYDRGYGRNDDYRREYDDRDYRSGQTWRGDDGRNYCRLSDGTVGLVVGGAAGALIGRDIAGRGDRTAGAVLGAAAGALLGRAVDRGGSRCR